MNDTRQQDVRFKWKIWEYAPTSNFQHINLDLVAYKMSQIQTG